MFVLSRRLRDCQRLAGLCRKQVQAGRVSLAGVRSASGLSDFQTKKILGEFDILYDRNKDGLVDRRDIENYRRELNDYYAATRGQMSQASDHGFDDYWILLKELADANKDGVLSKQEWTDIWTTINEQAKDISFSSLPQWVRLMPCVMFTIMDIKSDGILDAYEYKNFWYFMGNLQTDDAFLQHVMDTMTEQGKYDLNLHRFESLYADFYLSQDKSSPGKYMAGPVEYE